MSILRPYETKRVKKRNLSYFIGDLRGTVRNDDDLGTLLGYTLISSQMANFKKLSDNEMKKDQVTAFYDGLVTSSESLRDCSLDIVLPKLREGVDKYMSGLKNSDFSSRVLLDFLDVSKCIDGNYQTHLRILGSTLNKGIIQRGRPLGGNSNSIQLGDYDFISGILSELKGSLHGES